MTDRGYASYDNFLVETSATGEPIRYAGGTFKAAGHLANLLAAASEGQSQQLLGLPCQLVAFSKSGVVLNQILAEMAEMEASSTSGAQLERPAPRGTAPQASTSGACPAPAHVALDGIDSIHYLDCGLAGRGVHLTDPKAAEMLGERARRRPLAVHFHGTPRQWADTRRPWIRQVRPHLSPSLALSSCIFLSYSCLALLPQEKDRSAALLRAAGVPVTEHAYFDGCKQRNCGGRAGLRQHFQAIGAADLTSLTDH